MALIKCPECGKEVSDKAPACIHCGYPLQESQPREIIWNGRDVTDIEKYFNSLNSDKKRVFVLSCEYLEDRNKGCGDPTYKNLNKPNPIEWYRDFYDFIAEIGYKWQLNNDKVGIFILNYLRSKNFASTPQQPTINSNVVRCPRCGSTSVTTEEQGYGLFGWIGAAQKKNLCQKCGHKWWPGR